MRTPAALALLALALVCTGCGGGGGSKPPVDPPPPPIQQQYCTLTYDGTPVTVDSATATSFTASGFQGTPYKAVWLVINFRHGGQPYQLSLSNGDVVINGVTLDTNRLVVDGTEPYAMSSNFITVTQEGDASTGYYWIGTFTAHPYYPPTGIGPQIEGTFSLPAQ